MRHPRRTPLLTVALAAVVTVGLVTPAGAATTAARPAVTAVPSVDLNRYQGHWYQLAAVPQLFEIQCEKNVTADYTLVANGQVEVVNTCAQYFGLGNSVVQGRARSAVAGSTSKLEVSFLGFGDTWTFVAPGTYWVIGLDPDYRWAIVGEPSRASGFVLSRTPALGAADVAAIRASLRANGYDPCSLAVTPQTGGARSTGPLC